ncbi:MAG: hypothetical protein GTO02_18645, partial [Candidatus Dadabacteria bacterium]|nr:hypothetical protein [Candidatus Dadabacteria bacterium]
MPAAHTKAPDIQIAFDVPDGVEMALGYLTTDENGILQGDLVSSGQIDIAANEGIMIKI